MLHTLRAKLIAIVGTAALAFGLLAVSSTLFANHVERQLQLIRRQYLPKIEAGPKLEADFERLRRSFQDAAAAQDGDALAATSDIKDQFFEELAKDRDSLDAASVSALHIAMEDYFVTAYDMSRRVINGETGEELVSAMSQMQNKQLRVTQALKTATMFNRGELAAAFDAATRAHDTETRMRLVVSCVCFLLVLLLSSWLGRRVLRSLSDVGMGLQRFGDNDFSRPIAIFGHDELAQLAQKANDMATSLQTMSAERDRNDWLKSGHAVLGHELRGDLEPTEVARRAVRALARYLEAPSAVLYYNGDNGTLRPLGQYASTLGGLALDALPSFRHGEGLLGDAATQEDLVLIENVPADYSRVRSGLGESTPSGLVLLPLVHLGRVTGVLELSLFKPWTAASRELLLSVRETLAIAIEVARSRSAMRDLLEATQTQAQRLATQEDELKAGNEELQAQQEELRQTNEELVEQAHELEAQREALQDKNAQLSEAQKRLEQKAEELSTVSAYKSQFLANMSHELRTPLNSMLLLSNLLSDNDAKNLTDKQVEYCKTIHGAGKDLLALINQVLDLAKIEAGRQEVRIETVTLRDCLARAQRLFGPMAKDKGLALIVELAPELPETLETDAQRLDQIVTNLVGNAIKFTEHGTVTLRASKPEANAQLRNAGLVTEPCVAIAVSDTGIGISTDQQERIFVPFEQIDGRIDRRYGGSGLGLTIARELCTLLGGELQLQSERGVGSTFTCYLPLAASPRQVSTLPAHQPANHNGVSLAPRTPVVREQSEASELLVIEDDLVFAGVLGDVIRDQGFVPLMAADGATGLRLAKERRPRGIVLDVKLDDMDGWTVMQALRSDPATADIPVHFVSALEASERGLAMGAIGYLTKPASRQDLIQVVQALSPNFVDRECRVLIVEDDAAVSDSLSKQLRDENLYVRCVASATRALSLLTTESFGCMVLDLSLPDMDGLDFLQALRAQLGAKTPPVVVYTGRPLSKTEAQRLDEYAEAVVLKEGPSAERLLDEIRLFAHRFKQGLPLRPQPSAPAQLGNVRLLGVKVLVVDDDMRTVYALSAMLRAKGLEVLVADTGVVALARLDEHPDIQLVLMDLMMPEMDGYEAMRRMRRDPRFINVPIIALTAKAMKGDRDKCLEAGATDYLPKPVDGPLLLGMIQTQLAGLEHHAS